MLTLRRFRTIADSYGADLKRWPKEAQADAQSLLEASPQARDILKRARKIDDAIEASARHEDAMLWRPGEQDAALARLRTAVAARTAAQATHRPMVWTEWAFRLFAGWVPVTLSGGVAIMAGLFIGTMYDSTPASDSLLTMLQVVPLHILAD